MERVLEMHRKAWSRLDDIARREGKASGKVIASALTLYGCVQEKLIANRSFKLAVIDQDGNIQMDIKMPERLAS